MNCMICGHKISSEESLQTGMGSECRHAYNLALFKTIMSNSENSLRYNWLIKVEIFKNIFISEFKNTKFRSEFRKSFYNSINNSDRVSKKQLNIIIDWLEMKCSDSDYLDKLHESVKVEKSLFLKSCSKDIKINRQAIELARKDIRNK